MQMNYSPSKESISPQLTAVTRLIRRLEMEHVNPPELRALKQEHHYLERLHFQRLKIEQLRQKYTQMETEWAQVEKQNQAQQRLIQHQQKIIRDLQLALSNQQTQTKIEIAKAKQQMQDQIKAALSKHMEAQQRQESLQESVNQMKKLIARQSQALKLQADQYDTLKVKYSQSKAEADRLQLTTQQQQHDLVSMSKRLHQCQIYIEQLKQQLIQQRQTQHKSGQLQQVRKRLYQMRKDQIEKIEFVVNDLQG